MSEIHFHGKLTEAEFANIGKLAMRKFTIVFRAGGVLVGLLMIASFSWEQFTEQAWSSIFVYIVVALLITGGWPVFTLLQRRVWKNNKLIQRPISGTADSEAVLWNVEGISSSRIPWDLFMKY